MSEPMKVSYEAYVVGARLPFVGITIPFRYQVLLYVEDIPTGIGAMAWGRNRAKKIMSHLVNHGNELINEYGVAAEIAATIYARRREEAMAKVHVGDSIKLAVDIGQYKKGRVCKVVEVAEPSFYEARGPQAWNDEEYPVLVVPVHSPLDKMTLGPKDAIPLRRGEFGPLDMEVDE